METATEPTLIDRVDRLRAQVADILAATDEIADELMERGIRCQLGDDELVEELGYALQRLDVLLTLRCDPMAYRYWVDRVYLHATLDELRAEADAQEWALFMEFHQRFETRFPGLARELANEARRMAVPEVRPVNDRLERRALRALGLMAGEAE